MRRALAALLFALSAPLGAAEADYQLRWCQAHDGHVPGRIADGTYPDCITPAHAVEVDYGHKWAEAVGQALNYAMWFGRPAGIVLIVESSRDQRGLVRLKHLVAHYRLPVELVDVLGPEYLDE